MLELLAAWDPSNSLRPCYMVKEKKPTLFFLMETKMMNIKNCFLKNKIGYDGMFVVDCMGGSGGLTLLWKKFTLPSKIIS